MSITASVRGVGDKRAMGTCEWNKRRLRLSREMASASMLSTPGIWTTVNEICRCVVMKKRLRSKCIR